MKPLGIVRKIDSLGRIVLPADVRREHGWNVGTPVEMYADRSGLFIQSYGDRCAICGEVDDLMEVKRKYICVDCYKEVVKP